MTHRYWANTGILTSYQLMLMSPRRRKKAMRTLARLGWDRAPVVDAWNAPDWFKARWSPDVAAAADDA